MPNEIETVRRRIIVDAPTMESNNSPVESKNEVRSKKLQRLLKHNLKEKLKELEPKVIHTDISYYTDVLGIELGNIKVDVDNYIDVLMACDKEAKRRGFLF